MAGTVITAGTTRTQAGATLLTEEVSRVDTSTAVTSGLGDGVLLPSVGGGSPRFTVINNTNNPIQVYASGTDTINGAQGSWGVTLQPHVVKVFAVSAPGAWHYDATPAARWGFVATGCGYPYNNDSSHFYWMCRTAHTATDDLNMIRVCYVNLSAGGATSTTAAVNATIEYNGVIQATMTFYGSGGTATGTIPINGLLWSDPIIVSIPKGAQFWVRTHLVQGAGAGTATTTNTAGNQNSSSLGERSIGSATAVTDTTTSTGTFTATQNQIIRPLAIVGVTAQPSVLIIGDSRCDGTSDSSYNGRSGTLARTDTGNIAPSLFAASFGYCRYAITGVQCATIQSQVASSGTASYLLNALMNYATHTISDMGINDIRAGGGNVSAATLTASQAFLATLNTSPLNKFYACTLGPVTTSSDSWATTGNQTLDTNNAARVTYNTNLRNGTLPTGFVGAFDIASQYESSLNSGLWKANGTASFYTSDGIHGNSVIYDAIVTSGVLPTANLTR